MYQYEKRRLSFQLVPYTAWNINLRSMCLNWKEISRKVREKGKCKICGKKTDNLHAHEVWMYDDEHHLQLLSEIIPVCENCHMAIHIGKANVDNETDKALDQYIKVNNLSKAEALRDMDEAFSVWRKRSTFQWILNEEQISQKVFHQTGIVCQKEFCEFGRYYAFVPYDKKDIAKKQGAKWDSKRKLWYFPDEESRGRWNQYYSSLTRR